MISNCTHDFDAGELSEMIQNACIHVDHINAAAELGINQNYTFPL